MLGGSTGWAALLPSNALECAIQPRARTALTALAPEVRIAPVSHPEPNGPPDLTPVQVGEVWENPVTRERAKVVEIPYMNPEGRATAELTALVGARIVGEHRHPGIVERFTVLEGELTVKRDGQTSVLRESEGRRRRTEHVARLVECERPRRSRARGSHPR